MYTCPYEGSLLSHALRGATRCVAFAAFVLVLVMAMLVIFIVVVLVMLVVDGDVDVVIFFVHLSTAARAACCVYTSIATSQLKG